MDILKLDDGTRISGFIGGTVSLDGNSVDMTFDAAQNTCEGLKTALTGHTSTFSIITTNGDGAESESDPSVGFSKIESGISLLDGEISLTLRKLTAAEQQNEALRAAVAAGTITPELYKQITGEDYTV